MKKRISVSIFSCVWILVLFLLDVPYILPMILAVALHECGHLFCARLLKIRVLRLEFSMLGARINIDDTFLSYKNEFLLAMSGPLAGAIGFALCFPISSRFCALHFFSEFLLPFSVISLCLALFNLIPIDTLDGGRMLRCAISQIFSSERADLVMKICTFLTLILLWSLSVYMMIKVVSGLTLFIFSAILFINFFIKDNKTCD